ncbi:hypothetical protein Aperf_G00000037363 [Anoplocephala perfoliata]
MGDKRKLQCDIDRTLKKVQEGRAAFQEILDKFEASNSQTQKEKYESDLKKEIKRLQRYRDQIKTWCTSNEIKDKRQLEEARRLIEQDMERFKVIEKETKTKAYSKEGLLSADAKKDPLQKEKEEMDEWLKQSIASLKTKSEAYEYELETLTTTGKKKRVDREKAALIEEKKQKIKVTACHIERLETVMRLLDNERLEISKVRALKENIEYVIESLDYTYGDDYKSWYEELHLDELSDGTILTPNAVPAPAFVEYESNPAAVPAALAKSAVDKSKALPVSAAVNQTAPSSTAFASSSNATLSTNKKSFAGAAAKHQQVETSKLELERHPVTVPDVTTHRENYAKVAGESKKDRTKKEAQQQQQQLQQTEQDSKPASQTAGNAKNDKKKPDDLKVKADTSDSNATEAAAKPSSPARNVPTSEAPAVSSSTPANLAPQNTFVAKNPLFTVASTPQPTALPVETPVLHPQLHQSEETRNSAPRVICVNPRDALAPFRNRQLDQNRIVPPELKAHLQSLEAAYRRMPQPTDLSKSRMIITKRPALTPSYYPSEPMRTMDQEQYFLNLDAQTLFFIFYYFDSTRAQYLAAKALKRMSWRFHTKLMYWFQRNEEPKQITDEYESGAYLFYDYQTMRQCKRDEFVFEYKYLEDNEL